MFVSHMEARLEELEWSYGVDVLPDHRCPAFATAVLRIVTTYIALFPARGLEPWYSRHGFVQRPHKRLGPGMAYVKKRIRGLAGQI